MNPCFTIDRELPNWIIRFFLEIRKFFPTNLTIQGIYIAKYISVYANRMETMKPFDSLWKLLHNRRNFPYYIIQYTHARSSPMNQPLRNNKKRESWNLNRAFHAIRANFPSRLTIDQDSNKTFYSRVDCTKTPFNIPYFYKRQFFTQSAQCLKFIN